jgi:hypothetical protein
LVTGRLFRCPLRGQKDRDEAAGHSDNGVHEFVVRLLRHRRTNCSLQRRQGCYQICPPFLFYAVVTDVTISLDPQLYLQIGNDPMMASMQHSVP